MAILNSFYKVVQMENRYMFLIKFCYLLSEWFFCISVKACCITFQGHLVIKDFVEVIEFGTLIIIRVKMYCIFGNVYEQ